jgi:ABC-type oligopeptide transport system substrate-binding subunit
MSMETMNAAMKKYVDSQASNTPTEAAGLSDVRIDQWEISLLATHSHPDNILEAKQLCAQAKLANALQAKNARLVEALKDYGWHQPQCEFLQDALPCTCGLLRIISENGND